MRLVDADALLERVGSEKIQAQAHGREFSTCFMSPGGTPSTEWWYVEDLIENAPTIEPEIIRCCDCRNWSDCDESCLINNTVWYDADEFCSKAERKTDEID